MTFIVVLGLVVVVILVVVLVALGMRANRAARDDGDMWADEEMARRAAAAEEVEDGYGTGYDNAGYENGENGEYDDGGYDRRVAGSPLAAPTPSAPVAARPGRASDEMEDDDYWATITFDKPKFPWQHDRKAEPDDKDLADDPLGPPEDDAELPAEPAPAAATLTQPDGDPYGKDDTYGNEDPYAAEPYAAEPYAADPLSTAAFSTGDFAGDPRHRSSAGAASPAGSGYGAEPLDLPVASSGAPQTELPASFPPPRSSDPLGIPVARAETRDADATQAFSSGIGSSGGGLGGTNGLGGGGGLGTTSGIGGFGDPLGVGSRATSTGSSPMSPPLSSGSGLGSAGDSDPGRLPTVDELLQRIQTDRQRSSASDTSSYGEPSAPFGDSTSGYGDSSSYGDPTPSYGDPLSTGGDSSSYGNGPSPAPWPSSGQQSYGSDPLRTVSDEGSPAGRFSGGGLSGTGLSGGYSGGYSAGAQPGGGQGGDSYDTGYAAASSGQANYAGDGYPSAPAYGEAPRYDGPLGGRDFGPLGGSLGDSSSPPPLSAPPPSTTGTGTGENRYTDYSGQAGGYPRGTDPLSHGGGYDAPSARQPGYGAGTGYYGSEGGYDSSSTPAGSAPATGSDYDLGSFGSSFSPAAPSPSGSPSSPSGSPDKQPPSEDWDNYRGFRS